jgi:acyl-CoA synthetase (NDP forming)
MASHKDLTPLLSPKTIAVIGASEKFGAGSLVIENLRTLGFEGTIVPVNPGYTEVLGLPCYPSLADIPPGSRSTVWRLYWAADGFSP